MNMKNAKWANDYSALEEGGASIVDEVYSKAYLRHLFHANEILALQIASIHNLAFYLWLVAEARRQIISGNFMPWKQEIINKVQQRIN